jgi:plasmid stabilization system protein ParE
MRVTYRARALADIDDIFQYLEKRSPTGAHNVVRAIYDSIRLISEQPYGSERTNDPNIHVKVVRRYRYKIFYSVIDAGTIRIIHIRHTSRLPWVGD